MYGSRLDKDQACVRENKTFGLAALLGAMTLVSNSLRRWLGQAKPGEEMPTYLQEIKHALKVMLLHYFNMNVAAKLRGTGGSAPDVKEGLESPQVSTHEDITRID